MKDINELSRMFRNEIRDSEQMKEVYRAIRDARDKVFAQGLKETEQFLKYFESLSMKEQIELLVFLYEKLFGENK